MPDRLPLPEGPQNHYRVLGVSPDVDQHAVLVAYRGLAKQFHPDRNGSAIGRRLMLVINEAYEALKTPERRAVYDRSLGRQPVVPPSTPIPGSGAPSTRPSAPPPAATAWQDHPVGPLHRRVATQQGDRPAGVQRVLEHGRYAGRSVRDVAAVDRDYLEWFVRTPLGRPYASEVQEALR